MTYLDVPSSPSRFAWRHELADRAELHGWRVIAMGADWDADMLLIRRPRIIWLFAEPDRGRLSAPRLAALLELRTCRQEAYVLRPSETETVDRLLS